MTLYIIYTIIILVTIILYFLVKDKKEFLKKIGITAIISGIITLFLGLFANIALNTFLDNFNITKISALVFQKFIYSGIFLLVIGLVEIFISKIIKPKKIKASSSSN